MAKKDEKIGVSHSVDEADDRHASKMKKRAKLRTAH